MSMISFNRVLLTLILGFTFLGCHQEWKGMNATKLKEIVAAQLHPGDSAEKIRQFLSENKIQYFYNENVKDRKRYEGSYRLPDTELKRGHTLEVDINVDKDGAFLSAQIADSYTGL